MEKITSAEVLRALLARPWPLPRVEGAFGRAPEVACHVSGQSLGDVVRAHLGPAALRWEGGMVRLDAAGAARERLRSCVRVEPDGPPFFEGERAGLLDALPAGVVDRLLQAADEATGYRLLEPAPGGDERDWCAGYATGGQWIEGLLPMAPEAALCVAGYDFAALVASEAAATLSVPGGGELRVDLLAYPALVAASLRCDVGWNAPALVDEELARLLPFGACRAVVELADALSEMGGPAAATRFLDDRAGSRPDGAVPVAAASDRPLPQ